MPSVKYLYTAAQRYETQFNLEKGIPLINTHCVFAAVPPPSVIARDHF